VSAVQAKIRPGQPGDLAALLGLYQAVAGQMGSLARRADEITPDYVQGFVDKAAHAGVWLVAEDEHGLCADIHASRPSPRDFQHVLGDLTVVVHPRAQDHGLGRQLFTAFLDHVRGEEPGISRIELITRESNARARHLYESLGFQLEGRLRQRVRHSDGRMEDDLFYAWLRAKA
jgi:RimJ/RimL family protein N-acetyltransferase